jgi:hypothetical protein
MEQMRELIAAEFKAKNLPVPRKPKSDAVDKVFELLDSITMIDGATLSKYSATLNEWYNFFTDQGVKKKIELMELESQFNDILYGELERIDVKQYKTISERRQKAVAQNEVLKKLDEKINFEKGKLMYLENLEKILDKSMYTVSRELTRRLSERKDYNG